MSLGCVQVKRGTISMTEGKGCNGRSEFEPESVENSSFWSLGDVFIDFMEAIVRKFHLEVFISISP